MTLPRGELTTYRAWGGHATDWANPTRSDWHFKWQLKYIYNFMLVILLRDNKKFGLHNVKYQKQLIIMRNQYYR